MDTRTVFRQMVKNKYIEDYDYTNMSFLFQTVFHKLSYRYCCCACAFEHEFMDYISQSGEINEVMYERVVDNIVKGKCPHVDEVPAEYVRETGVYGIHIAAVVGTETAIKKHMENYSEKLGKLFHLNPYMTALVKNNRDTVAVYYGALSKIYQTRRVSYIGVHVLHGIRSLENRNRVCFEDTSVLEFCVKTRNQVMLKAVLHSNIVHTEAAMARALALTFKYNLKGMQQHLLEYMSSLARQGYEVLLKDSARSAIVYDQPTGLDQILKDCLKGNLKKERTFHSLAELCYVLQRKQCQDILCKYTIYPQKAVNDRDNYVLSKLLGLLEKYNEDFKDEIICNLKQITNIHDAINTSAIMGAGTILFHHLPLLHIHLKSKNINVIKVMLDLGANIDSINSEGNTPLTHLLWTASYENILGFRKALEFLIYENSSINLNTSAVKMGIKADVGFHKYADQIDIPGDYITDNKIHSLFKHNLDTYALNFTTPLLIECGYAASRGILLYALGKDLHAAELAYIQHCAETVRPLKLHCRDVLRKYYKGRHIHDFVAASKIPVKIGEFILLKTHLRFI